MRRAASRPLVGTLAGALLGTLASGCVPASPDADTYDHKTALTLGSAVSDVRTVQRIMETMYDGRMLGPTAVAQLRYSEDALDTATNALTELNPPPERDRLNQEVSSLLSDGGELLTQARIALEREEEQRLPKLAKQLDEVAVKMEQIEGRLS